MLDTVEEKIHEPECRKIKIIPLKQRNTKKKRTEQMNRISLNCGTISSGSTCNSVQFSHSVMSDSLRPHGLQHARPPCQSPTPRVYSKSCPLSLWCHPVISSFVVTFSSCLQSFSASGSFQMSPLFASGGQSLGVSTSASVLPMNI